MSDTLVTIRTLKLKMVLRWENARELFMVLAWVQILVMLKGKRTVSNTVGTQLVVELCKCPSQVECLLKVQQTLVGKSIIMELLFIGNVY